MQFFFLQILYAILGNENSPVFCYFNLSMIFIAFLCNGWNLEICFIEFLQACVAELLDYR